jgi:hypothetical protein
MKNGKYTDIISAKSFCIILVRLTSWRSQRTLAIVWTLSWPCCRQSLWYSSRVSNENAITGSTGADPSKPCHINDTLAGSSNLWCIWHLHSRAWNGALEQFTQNLWTNLQNVLMAVTSNTDPLASGLANSLCTPCFHSRYASTAAGIWSAQFLWRASKQAQRCFKKATHWQDLYLHRHKLI